MDRRLAAVTAPPAARACARPLPTSDGRSSRTDRRLAAVTAALLPRPAAAIDTVTKLGLPPTSPPGPLRQNEQSLTDQQRDRCLEEIDRDSYTILPVRLPLDMIERALAFIDGFCADPANYLAPPKLYEKNDPRLYGQGFHMTNIVETDDVFREFLTYKPALQLCCESSHSSSHQLLPCAERARLPLDRRRIRPNVSPRSGQVD
jgi:hypothetical protein